MKRFFFRALFVVVALFCVASPLMAFRIAAFNGTPTTGWPSGDIVMELALGGTSGSTLIDGNTTWGVPAENALAIWNQILGRTQFKVVRDSTIPRVFGDGKNSVYFDSKIPGGTFGTGVVAVTVIHTAGTDQHLIEADVIFNNQVPYNSYRGSLLSATSGGTLNDLRRVALREFGRVLGL